MRGARRRNVEFQAVPQPFWLKGLLKRGRGNGTSAPRLAWDGAMSGSVAVQPFDCKPIVDCILDRLSVSEKLRFFAEDLDAIDHVSGVPRLYVPGVNMGDGTSLTSPVDSANFLLGSARHESCVAHLGLNF